MKHFNVLKALLLSITIATISACSNDEPIENQQNNETEKFSIIAKYKGITYEVPCISVNDSVIYLNKDFEYLYRNEISLIPNLATLATKDEFGTTVLEYYQSSDELEKENGIKYFNNKVSDNTMSRATINPEAGRAILFDDKRFRDRSVVLDIDFDLYVKKVDLKLTDKFNDKTSSILIWNRMKPNYYYGPSYIPSYSVLGKNLRTCLICFEDKYCQGKVLYCVAPHTGTEDFTNYSTAGHKDWNLKDIGWGDKISSVIFRIITTEDIQNGIYKPH